MFHKVSDINYGRQIKRFNDSISEGPTRADFLKLLQELKQEGSNAAVLRKFCDHHGFMCNQCEENHVPDNIFLNQNILIQGIFKPHYEGASLEELREIGRRIVFSISPSEIESVEKLTRDQSFNPFWHYVRIGRVTASIMKEVVNASIESPPPKLSLLKKICHPYLCNFDTPALSYGRSNETKGKEYVKNVYKDHINVEFLECGIFLNSEKPFVAASPDMIVTCDCCGRITVEIKCPFRLRKSDLNKQLSLMELAGTRDPFIKVEGDAFVLVRSHSYYYQLQTQIFVTNSDFGLFVVWSRNEQVHIIVQKDVSVWLRCMLKCEQYFRRIICPELLGNYYSNSISLLHWRTR